jgi:hypothetical protein
LRGKPCPWLLGVLVALVMTSCQEQINYPVPRIATVSPTSVVQGQPQFTITVTGYNFTPASTVDWNGPSTGGGTLPLATFFTSTNELTATVTAALAQNPGSALISVSTPQPGGGATTTLPFSITGIPTPVPTITAISPTIMLTFGGGGLLTVTGTNFVSSSTIYINNTSQPTNFQNADTLTTGVSQSEVANSGVLSIVVVNPATGGGGGSSNAFSLPINNPVPTASTISPAAVGAGTTAPTLLTVTGTGFVPTSQIVLNGTPRATTFAGSTSIAAQLSASDMAAAGIQQLQVINPAPVGGTSFPMLAFAVDPDSVAPTGLPEILDYAPDGTQANNGICGGVANCQNGTLGLTLSTSGPSSSQTGQFMAFASSSSNLTTNQTTSSSNIFYRDSCLSASTTNSCVPVTTIVNTAANGGAANGPSSEPTIDGGGDRVAYTSKATNLINYASFANVPSGTRQVYSQPVCTSTPASCITANDLATLISLGADGNPGNGDSYNPVISPDGQYVAFVSLATNLVAGVSVDGFTPQVYLRATCGILPPAVNAGCTPTTYLVSSVNGATPGNGPSSHPSIALTGLFVSFSSTASNLGVPNPSARSEVYEQSTCVTTIGQTGNTCAPSLSLISTPDGTTPADGQSVESSLSSDGRFVAFASTATNLGTNPGAFQQIYARDTCTGFVVGTVTTCTPATRLVSTPDGTTPAQGLSEYPSVNQCGSGVTTTCGTGQFIAFASVATNLASNVENGVENIFVRNTCEATAATSTTTTSTAACTPATVLVSQPPGTSPPSANGSSYAPSISGDGHVASFISFSDNLVTPDTNGIGHNGLEDVFMGATSF